MKYQDLAFEKQNYISPVICGFICPKYLGSYAKTINRNLNLTVNSFPTRGDICRWLITFANILDSDQARLKRWALSGSKLFDTLMLFLKDFFGKS